MYTFTPPKFEKAKTVTYIKTDWRSVPEGVRDELRAFRLWLQDDLDVAFQLEYWRLEDTAIDAAKARLDAAFQRIFEPYAIPTAQTDDVIWAGQVLMARPNTIRLKTDVPVRDQLGVLAHEARHVWQLKHFQSFVPIRLVQTRNIPAVRRFMEADADDYTGRVVPTWLKGRNL